MASKHIEDEVRKRYAELLAAAGLHENRVATEILYWLPQDFMDAYRELFGRALSLDDGAKTGGRAGDENQVVKVKKERGKRGSMRATGSGKRYVNRVWVVRDETMLEVKRRVDRHLVGLVERIQRKVMEERGEIAEVVRGGQVVRTLRVRPGELVNVSGDETVRVKQTKLVEGSQGGTPGMGEVGRLVWMDEGRTKKRCGDCGRIAKGEWARCPFH